MDAMGATLLVIACVCAGLCVAMAIRARRQSHWLEAQARLVAEHRAQEAQQLLRLQAAHELGHWFVWWARNAAEPFPRADPQREHQLRYALAAMFAPDVATFIERMHSVSQDAAKSQNERLAAAAFCGEWELAQRTGEAPWLKYTRETGRTELYAAGRMDQLFRDAVMGWDVLLGSPVRLTGAAGNCPAHATEQD